MASNELEAAAKTLAECMDYPWEHMPEKGREAMRQHAAKVAAPLLAAERERVKALLSAEQAHAADALEGKAYRAAHDACGAVLAQL